MREFVDPDYIRNDGALLLMEMFSHYGRPMSQVFAGLAHRSSRLRKATACQPDTHGDQLSSKSESSALAL